MHLVKGRLANGKESIELGKGSLHIYFPNQTYVVSDIKKQHWYFEGKMIKNNSQIILEGTGDVEKDFKVLSQKRKYSRELDWVWSFDIVYKTSRGLFKVHVY